MDRDANYVAVGAFVILVVAMGVAFVLWYTEHQNKHQYNLYEIYFRGSVSGLNEGSTVRFLGVNVGRVTRVAVDSKERNRVQVIAEIETSAPIDGRTLASLSLQGVTGLLFIDLEQGSDSKVPASLTIGENYPVIRSKSSDFDKLLSALPTVAGHVDEMILKLNHALSDDNVQSFTETLQYTRIATARLSQTMLGVDALLVQLKSSAVEIERTSAALRSLAQTAAPDIRATVENTRRLAENLAAASQRLDRLLAENQAGVSRFTNQGLPEIERLMRETSDTAKQIRELSRSLRQNPSQLIYEPKAAGIEVAR